MYKYLGGNGYRTAVFGLQHVTGPEPGKPIEDKVRGLGFEGLYLASNLTALVVAPMVVDWLRKYGGVSHSTLRITSLRFIGHGSAIGWSTLGVLNHPGGCHLGVATVGS